MYHSHADMQEGDSQHEYTQTSAADEELLEQERIQRQKLLEEMTKPEEELRVSGRVQTAIKAVGGGFLVFVYIYLIKNRYFSWQMAAITGGGFVIALTAGMIADKLRKKKDKREGPFSDEPESSFHTGEPEPDHEFAGEEPREGLISEENQTCLLYPEKLQGNARLLPVTPADGQEIILEEGVTVIGKLEGAVDAVLNYPAVSRLHAKIVRNGNCKVYDMNSKNGTYVNHEAVVGEQGCEVQDGDLITFANLTYRLQFWEE